MSGHSKWSQIKHKKASTDAKRGQLFSKIVREIMVAVRTGGGPAPESNMRLKTALERARSTGLPKENIERAIQRASGGETGETLHEFLFEATAPHGVMVLIEGISDNTNRTGADIRKILAEHNAKLADQGSLSWNFEKVGVMRILKEGYAGRAPDDIELALIDAGAKDLRSLSDEWIVETDFTNLDQVRSAIEKKGIAVEETGHDYTARAKIKLSNGEQQAIERLADALTDLDDVQEVYTNLNT